MCRSISALAPLPGSTLRVTTGLPRPDSGQSHSWGTATRLSSSSRAQTISVALGSREAIRISAGRHERVEQHLLLDRGAGAMPRVHHSLWWKRIEHFANAEDDLSHVAARQISPADAP